MKSLPVQLTMMNGIGGKQSPMHQTHNRSRATTNMKFGSRNSLSPRNSRSPFSKETDSFDLGFTIIPSKMPEICSKRYFNLENLTKPAASKNHSSKGSEKKVELPWIHNLRNENISIDPKTGEKKPDPVATVPMPPRFYDEDQQKWEKKFEKSIAERE